MFDTPDLGPLCIAPFISIVLGLIFYSIGRIICYFARNKINNNLNRWKSLILIFSILTLPISCIASIVLDIGEREPAPWFAPTSKSIIGKWELTPDKIENLEKWNKINIKPHELVFNSDGTFYVKNIPTFWGLWDDNSKKWNAVYISGSGNWNLGQIEGTERLEWIVFIQFREINSQKVDITNQEHRIRLYFVGHLPPYILRSLDGDLGFDFRKK